MHVRFDLIFYCERTASANRAARRIIVFIFVGPVFVGCLLPHRDGHDDGDRLHSRFNVFRAANTRNNLRIFYLLLSTSGHKHDVAVRKLV